MKKILLLLFVTALLQVNAQSDDYDFKIKKDIDINAVIDITNSDAIFNRTGTRSLGYGWYVTTAIWMEYDISCNATWSTQGAFGYADEATRDGISSALIGGYTGESRVIYKPIRIKGKCYAMCKKIYQKVDRYGNVILSRSEAISRIKELKELLSLDIITQSEYDEEFQRLKKLIVR